MSENAFIHCYRSVYYFMMELKTFTARYSHCGCYGIKLGIQHSLDEERYTTMVLKRGIDRSVNR